MTLEPVLRSGLRLGQEQVERIRQTVEEFVQSFSDSLEVLLAHDFVAKSQSDYLRNLKGKLQPGEVIITGDFSENYSMVLQDEIQSHHFQKGQATIHPFVAYWKEGDELKHTSYAEISDCLTHDTVSVHLFQKKFINYLETKMGARPSKIFYFTDGCAAQYKNCNFYELDLSSPALQNGRRMAFLCQFPWQGTV